MQKGIVAVVTCLKETPEHPVRQLSVVLRNWGVGQVNDGSRVRYIFSEKCRPDPRLHYRYDVAASSPTESADFLKGETAHWQRMLEVGGWKITAK